MSSKAELKKLKVSELRDLLKKAKLYETGTKAELVDRLVESKRGKKKPRKVRDPNAPKRPQTAFFLWLNENRSRLKKDNPGAKVAEIAKLAGLEWKTLSDAEKKTYQSRADRDKERYQKELATYKQ